MALDYLSVLGILTSIGDSIEQLFSSPAAIYALYFIVFFITVFTLISRLIQKFGHRLHLDGAPGNVIAFSFSVIAVGIIFINRSSQEIQELFHGSVGIFFIIIFAIGIGILAKTLSSKTSHFPTKLFYWSFAVWLASVLLIEAASAIWGSTSGGFGAAILNLIKTIASFATITMIISGIMALLHLVKTHAGNSSSIGSSHSSGGNKENNKNDLKDLQRILNLIDKEQKTISQGMQELRQMLQSFDSNRQQGGNR